MEIHRLEPVSAGKMFSPKGCHRDSSNREDQAQARVAIVTDVTIGAEGEEENELFYLPEKRVFQNVPVTTVTIVTTG